MLQKKAQDFNHSADIPPIATDDISELIRSINAKIQSAIANEVVTYHPEEDEVGKYKANAAKISKKLTQCFSLFNEIKNLEPNYKEKAIMLIKKWLQGFYKNLIEKVISEDWIYVTGLERLANRKLPNLEHLKPLQDKITSIKTKTSQFSEPVKQYFDSALEEQEKSALSSIDESEISYRIDIINLMEREIDYALVNPGLAEYSLKITGKVVSLDFLKAIQAFRKYAESINDALDNASEWENLLKKYDFPDTHYERVFLFIRDIKEIHLSCKQDAVTHEQIVKLLSRYYDPDIKYLLKNMPRLQWFDEKIAPLLSPNRRGEFAKLFIYKLDLSEDEFKKRVEGYLMVVNKLIESDTFNLEKRGRFAMNVRESLGNFCIEEIVINGANPEEVRSQIENELEQVNKSARVTINVHRSNLEKIYSKGELKTYHELGTTHREKSLFGNTNYDSRREEKDRQLQYSEDKFIVGALSSENGYDEFIGAAPFYGHGVIELKWDNIKDRVFFLECDSMARDDSDNMKRVMPEWLSKKWKNLDSRKLDYEGAKFIKALMEVYLKRHGHSHIHTMYVEAHVLQPVTTNDFAKVSYAVLHSNDKNADDKKRDELLSLRRTLLQHDGSQPALKIIEADLDLKVKDDPFKPRGQEQSLRNDEGF